MNYDTEFDELIYFVLFDDMFCANIFWKVDLRKGDAQESNDNYHKWRAGKFPHHTLMVWLFNGISTFIGYLMPKPFS